MALGSGGSHSSVTEGEIIRLMHAHFAGLFPRACPKCRRHFATLRDYILNTERIGGTISYDAELGEWTPRRPMGAVALANCACGNTLALSTEGLPLAQIHQMLAWVKAETERSGASAKDVIGRVRDAVRRQALADPAGDGGGGS